MGEQWLDGRASIASPVLKTWTGSSWIATSGFTVDDTNGNFSLAKELTVSNLIANGTGASSFVRIPQDTTAARATIAAGAGMIRFNTSTFQYEGHNGTSWENFALGDGDAVFEDLTATGNTIIGDNCTTDTLTITALTTINCDTTIGANSTQTLTIRSLLGSHFLPDGDLVRDLGSSTNRWANLYTGALNVTDLTVTGNTVLGDATTDTVSFTAQVATSILPSVDDSVDLGSPTNRWANIYTGDLHLANDRGDWTMIEEEDYLSLRNNKTGQVFKLSMEPVG